MRTEPAAASSRNGIRQTLYPFGPVELGPGSVMEQSGNVLGPPPLRAAPSKVEANGYSSQESPPVPVKAEQATLRFNEIVDASVVRCSGSSPRNQEPGNPLSCARTTCLPNVGQLSMPYKPTAGALLYTQPALPPGSTWSQRSGGPFTGRFAVFDVPRVLNVRSSRG